MAAKFDRSGETGQVLDLNGDTYRLDADNELLIRPVRHPELGVGSDDMTHTVLFGSVRRDEEHLIAETPDGEEVQWEIDDIEVVQGTVHDPTATWLLVGGSALVVGILTAVVVVELDDFDMSGMDFDFH
jgi:hypothetical protein